MFNLTKQQLASLYSAAFPGRGVHDKSASKANDQRTTQDYYSFRTIDNGVQRPGDPPSKNKGIPRRVIDKAIGSLQGSAGIRNSSTTVDSYGSSEHVPEHIPSKFQVTRYRRRTWYEQRQLQTPEDETDFSQPRVRRRHSAAFPSFLHKLADTKDPSTTAEHPSIDSSTSMFGASTEEALSSRTADNILPDEADSPWKESNRLQSIPEKETPAGSIIRFSLVLDDSSTAKKMSEAGRLRRTQSQDLNLEANSQAQDPTPEPPEHPPGPLRDLHDRQCVEIKEGQETIKRLEAENLREKANLSKSVQDANILRQENTASGQRISALKEQLSMVTAELNNLKEKQGWEGQLDAMQHRVQQAERQVRCLDNLTRLKLEAREDGAFGSVKRTTQLRASNQKPSADVIRLVVNLNKLTSEYAGFLTNKMRRKYTIPCKTIAQIKRSNDVLGSKVATRLRRHASLCDPFPPFLMRVILELFMVHWYTQIIEGWYPKQKCFADVLLEFSQTTNSSSAKVGRGKIKILQTDVTNSTNYSAWVSDILQDLSEIFSLGGVWIDWDPHKAKFITLVRLAYEVRTALAEKDLCGNLELFIVGSGMPFQRKWMSEEHPSDSDKSAIPSMKMDPVAGTCGIGLRRVGKTAADANQTADVVLKPKVVLEKVLDEEVP
ncbi:hypothetical protein CPC08DRAFT_728488 [Agrocybe pediades]|nr:hypothetical protein CPC08DRAFT_728488 [Agrocybe pediades]